MVTARVGEHGTGEEGARASALVQRYVFPGCCRPGKPRAVWLVSGVSQGPHSPPRCGGRQPEPGPCSPQGGLCSDSHATRPALHRSCGHSWSWRGCTRGPSAWRRPALPTRPSLLVSGIPPPSTSHLPQGCRPPGRLFTHNTGLSNSSSLRALVGTR